MSIKQKRHLRKLAKLREQGEWPCSEATKRKIGKANKGKKHTPEAIVRMSGKNHPNWKGGGKTNNGYIFIYCPKHPYSKDKYIYVKEERLVMEEFLRQHIPNSEYLIEINGTKYLRPECVVHHINFIKDDNRIENLCLFSNRSEHMKHHHFLRGNKVK